MVEPTASVAGLIMQMTPLVIPAALTVSGVWVGAILGNKRGKVDQAQKKVDSDLVAENTLIDQLQEELNVHRIDAGRRATAQDERMNALEKNNVGYREHIHELRSHIWEGHSPPPPAWPTGLPR